MCLLFFFILPAVLLILEVRLQRVVPRFYSSILLQAPRRHYVELNFTMQSSYLTPCIGDEYIEVRDGYNESANLVVYWCILWKEHFCYCTIQCTELVDQKISLSF